MGIKKTRTAKERHAAMVEKLRERNMWLQQNKGLFASDHVELSRKQRLLLLNASAKASETTALTPDYFQQSFDCEFDEEDFESLDPLVDRIHWYVGEKRPEGYKAAWPVNNFIIQRTHKSQQLAESFVLEGFKVVWLVKSNKDAIEAEEEFAAWHPDLEVRRYVSKAQNLKQRLGGVGVRDFELTYKEPKSPYALGDLDTEQTKTDLRKALDDAGAKHIDVDDVFEEEYVDYKFGPMGGDVDVMIFTFAKFTASMLPHKKPWWEREGLSVGERAFDWQGEEKTAAVGPDKIIVIYVDPEQREFDECRLIKPQYVEDLRAVHKRVTKRQFSYAHPQYFTDKGYDRAEAVRLSNLARDRIRHAVSTSVHHIIELNGEHFEMRPEQMLFPMCLRQGYGKMPHGLMPKALVLTSDSHTARDAYRAMMINATYWYEIKRKEEYEAPTGTLNYES